MSEERPRWYLHDEGLVLEAWRQAQHAHVGGLVDEVLNAVENPPTGGRDTAVDSPLADGLPRHTSVGVDVLHGGGRGGGMSGADVVEERRNFPLWQQQHSETLAADAF